MGRGFRPCRRVSEGDEKGHSVAPEHHRLKPVLPRIKHVWARGSLGFQPVVAFFSILFQAAPVEYHGR